jgi:hypothetical protein
MGRARIDFISWRFLPLLSFLHLTLTSLRMKYALLPLSALSAAVTLASAESVPSFVVSPAPLSTFHVATPVYSLVFTCSLPRSKEYLSSSSRKVGRKGGVPQRLQRRSSAERCVFHRLLLFPFVLCWRWSAAEVLGIEPECTATRNERWTGAERGGTATTCMTERC